MLESRDRKKTKQRDRCFFFPIDRGLIFSNPIFENKVSAAASKIVEQKQNNRLELWKLHVCIRLLASDLPFYGSGEVRVRAFVRVSVRKCVCEREFSKAKMTTWGESIINQTQQKVSNYYL